jgi:hypothetical protein
VVGARIGRRRAGTRRKPFAYRRFRDWQACRTESGNPCAYKFSPPEHGQLANLQGKRPSEPAEMPTSCGTPEREPSDLCRVDDADADPTPHNQKHRTGEHAFSARVGAEGGAEHHHVSPLLPLPRAARDAARPVPARSDQRPAPNTRHVATAHGRDHSDIPPLTGVIHTGAKTESLRGSGRRGRRLRLVTLG